MELAALTVEAGRREVKARREYGDGVAEHVTAVRHEEDRDADSVTDLEKVTVRPWGRAVEWCAQCDEEGSVLEGTVLEGTDCERSDDGEHVIVRDAFNWLEYARIAVDDADESVEVAIKLPVIDQSRHAQDYLLAVTVRRMGDGSLTVYLPHTPPGVRVVEAR